MAFEIISWILAVPAVFVIGLLIIEPFRRDGG
jgi:hypothetical protein